MLEPSQTIGQEIFDFNSLGYNNKRAFLCFVIDKERKYEGTCESCPYKFCDLCKLIIEDLGSNKALEFYQEITAGGFKGKFRI